VYAVPTVAVVGAVLVIVGAVVVGVPVLMA
jgi:hypothetical protein